ncbi:DNA topoisomerase III [Fusobacterium animalis 7_1]|uniref:DNA topoisomerase n=1 Tax=Fusobacterium animalis 7_1 TaxID=457405 RepID=A0A140PSQ4_9FUSO|nr:MULTISPECIES: DNA topoisomerase [Fusobacterium]EEO42930.1 DNA topoisomerase III [Fusobacterium animalis 7_1]EPC08362.1 DNA topoisomerase III [Fusobacterium polymorphum F0401]
MQLIIAEKKELAEDISKAIPGTKNNKGLQIEVGDYVICWVGGHILKLKDPEDIDPELKKWQLDKLPIYFEKWEKSIIKNKSSLFKNLKELIKKADIIIHAGDPDDEGQYLIDEIFEYLNCKKQVKRLLINDNSLEAVKRAFNKMENNNKFISLGNAAKARSIADIVLGINLSRFFTLTNKDKITLTVGRVQTPTLALVVNRDFEIENHVKEKYYDFMLNVDLKKFVINFKYYTQERITNKEDLEKIINKISDKNGIITISKKIVNNPPPLPFNLNNLQVEANNKFGYDVDKVLEITQALRDKFRAITYNRSECQYLTDEHFKKAPKLVPEALKRFEGKFKVDLSEENKSRCFNDKKVKVHYGIIPTYKPELDFDKFSEEEKNIYLLIVKRYLIQFMEKTKVKKTELLLEIEDEIFKKNFSTILDPGYRNFYFEIEENENNEEDEELSFDIPEGKFNFPVKKDDLNIIEKETKPKSRYTQASLIKDMNNIAKYVKNEKIKEILKLKDEGKDGLNGSIGTSATQASIISGLLKRGYLEEKGKNIYSTKLARDFLKILPEPLKTPDSTAIWWLIQEEIKIGNAKIEDLTLRVLGEVKNIINGHNKIIN